MAPRTGGRGGITAVQARMRATRSSLKQERADWAGSSKGLTAKGGRGRNPNRRDYPLA